MKRKTLKSHKKRIKKTATKLTIVADKENSSAYCHFLCEIFEIRTVVYCSDCVI